MVSVIRIMLFFAVLAMTASCAREAERPNIIFIMTDDHTRQAISAYGSVLDRTPNIDRLAEGGMLFENACVTNSICAPSRAVILTGKHSHLNGKIDNSGQLFDSSQVTFPKLLRSAGYQTAMIGKWHLNSLPAGFDYWRILPGQGQYYNPDFITPDGNIRIEGYVTDIITDLAIDWLESADREKPFLLMYQHKAPHREWEPDIKYAREYVERVFPEPPSLFDDFSGRGNAAREAEMSILKNMHTAGDIKILPEVMDELGIQELSSWDKSALTSKFARYTTKQMEDWKEVYGPINEDFRQQYPDMSETDLLRYKYQRYMQDYLACCASVDDNIGRLLDWLGENGLAENTIIVYTSDQGFYLGEHGWFDKRFIYRESLGTPLIVRWPGKVRAGSRNRQLVQNLDFAPTLLDAAGVEIPGEMQGMSLLPLLKEEAPEWRDALYYHYYEYPAIHSVKRHYGIITERYKLIHFYFDIEEWELYDLVNDPGEMQNLYDSPGYRDIRNELTVRLRDIREYYRDTTGAAVD